MTRIDMTELERSQLARPSAGYSAKHRAAQDIEIAELRNSLAMDNQKKTLRDEFAMAALPALILSYQANRKSIKDFSQEAYWFADAMMQERQKK